MATHSRLRYRSTVALSMPALWSCLDLTLALDCMGESGTVLLTELQIQRSQNMPLTLTIRDEEGPERRLASSPSARAFRITPLKVADLHMKPPLFQQMTAACGFSSLTTLLITIDLSLDDRFGEVSDFDDAFWNLFAAAPRAQMCTGVVLECFWTHHCSLYSPMAAAYSLVDCVCFKYRSPDGARKITEYHPVYAHSFGE
ncbi:hypothetical protein R3P38DRAFT_1281206 [Favolaschia claudopus]|uniref:Uncharacterized protein n=1 Tax=Favolaschia claudopus TaxID=2862362 RepID=A0AAW0B276_9AGAR